MMDLIMTDAFDLPHSAVIHTGTVQISSIIGVVQLLEFEQFDVSLQRYHCSVRWNNKL